MRKIVYILIAGIIFLTGCSSVSKSQTSTTAFTSMKNEVKKIQEANSTENKASPKINKKESFYDISLTMPESCILIKTLSSDNEKVYQLTSGCYIYIYRESPFDNLHEDEEEHKDEDFHVESALEDGVFNGLSGGYFLAGVFNKDGTYTLYIHNCIPIGDYCYSIVYQEDDYNDNNTKNAEEFYKVLGAVTKN